MIRRIGIAGAAGSGKTTAANYLVEQGFQILGFATPLYKLGVIHSTTPQIEWHSRVWGWCNDHLAPAGYSESERWFFTYKTLDIMDDTPIQKGKNRTLLQFIGTEVGRNLDESLWTNLFEAKVEELGDAKIINDNLRFPNEFDCLKHLGFTTVFLDTPVNIRRERYEQKYGVPMTDGQLNHSSEAYLDEICDNCDVVIENTHALTDLYYHLDETIKNNVARSV